MKKTLYIALALMMLLTGCAPAAGEKPVEEAAERIVEAARQISAETETGGGEAGEALDGPVKEAAQETLGTEVEAPEEETPEDFVQGRQALGLTEENYPALLSSQQQSYAFGCLDDAGRRMYVDILRVLEGMAENVEISYTRPLPAAAGDFDGGDISKVFRCVMNDHPELFYVEGYTYTKYTSQGGEEQIVRLTFSGKYTMDEAGRQERQEKIDRRVQECLSGIGEEASEYEKVKYVYEYLIKNTQYDLNAEDNQNICSVFLNSRSVCQGYAKSMQYLLNRLGIFADLVTGTVENGEGHAWNLVRVDGAYYYVDPTWGDAYYELSGGGADCPVDKLPSINYDYLCVTTKQLTRTHTIDNVVPLPECVSLDANYYVREDAYFTGYDRQKIAGLFDQAYEDGDEIVTIKCSGSEVYEEMKRMLLEAQEVFDYLRVKDGVVAYTDSREQLSISFWL